MSRPRLLYLVTEDWYFVTHRLPMARAARDAGYDVHVATRFGQFKDKITAEGFTPYPIDLHRGSINPFRLLAAIATVRQLYRTISPDLVHHIAIQPSVIGSIAAMGMNLPRLNSIFGFGSVFTSNVPKSRIARLLLRPLLPLLFNAKQTKTMVVNPDHRDILISLGVASDRIVVIPGSGADVTHFSPLPEPSTPVTAGYAGRMLEDKGVRELVEAHQLLEKAGTPLTLLLAGTPDPANPNSIPQAELESWARRPGITWLGHVADVRELWGKAHIAVLASHGEGLPMGLVEAAACGRPLVATDVPGCREIARDKVDGLLVPVSNSPALAAALGRLMADTELRRQFGAAGRRIVEQEFSSEEVARRIVAVYNALSDASFRSP
ncbi:MAG: glycosyltransferase family 4 protein [Pseudolabrys sp.]|nr:glycosyltransferase family 4 protein [Pseudolabrys sp.]